VTGEVIRVLLADDQAMVRAGLRVLLDSEPGIAVVAEAADGAEAVRAALDHRPDVVLMDIRMPTMNGIEATAQICAGTDARVLMLTTFDLDEYVYAALRAGASGFVLKDTPPPDLLAAIRVVADGDALLSPRVTRRLITAFARSGTPPGPPPTSLATITGREREVLELVARGLSNAEIADHLTLSRATVKTHMGRLLTKLDARDRAQLVIVAYETGLITPAARDG
jgi:DNA-binding NarL/FixJ family response regulator